jgi:hypothetical protein
LAENSVRKLSNLQPRIAATGHGKPMMGRELRESLNHLTSSFQKEAVPSQGRYVGSPALADESGVEFVPPFKSNAKFAATLFLGAAALSFLMAKSLRPNG